ncbi:hypothetical protein [Pseudomonas sp. GM55]|uniref:hypothetical protein n=1 Tax=Pseudomonas sp. GM55 TaxID=1144333 RepID=UPI0012F8795D|nr:hypothetical protein [Pseudomonas sp. GM55]
MKSTTDKNPPGLIDRQISPSQTMTSQSISVTGPALLHVTGESKIPTSVQNNSPETPGLELLQQTINSVDYYHCVYELLYRLIESSIALVPTYSPPQGAKQS